MFVFMYVLNAVTLKIIITYLQALLYKQSGFSKKPDIRYILLTNPDLSGLSLLRNQWIKLHTLYII